MGKVSYTSTKKYQDRVYDRVLVLFRAGQKTTIADHAAARGESLNAFINRAVAEAIQHDAAAAGVPAPAFAPLGASGAPATGDDLAADPAD